MGQMIERHDPVSYNSEQFLRDLKKTAGAIDAPFNDQTVRQTMEIFDAELQRCVVQIKATDQPNTGVYYRFFYKWERDLTSLAQQQGLILQGHDPIINLQSEVLERCTGATRAGADFDTSFGLAKIWTYTGGPTPLDKILQLDTIPDSVRTYREFFERYGMQHVFFVCSDFQKQSMNVYFGLEENCRNEHWLRAIIEETGGGPDNPSDYKKMLNSLAVSAGIGTTFFWDRPEMGRWSLYALNVPLEDPSASSLLPVLPDRLKRFRDQAPTLNRAPQYNVAWSFGPTGFYTKIEKSYAKDADYFLTVEMGGDLTRLCEK